MTTISQRLTDQQRALESGVTQIRKRYPAEYWRDLDARREYPEKFVEEPGGEEEVVLETKSRSAVDHSSI